METALISPAQALFFGIPATIFSILIPVAGIALFAYIMYKRFLPLLNAKPDHRFNRIPERIVNLLKIWLLQWRHPRYMLAGVLHIIIFAGFLVLSIRSTSLVFIGIFDGFVFPGLGGAAGDVYNFFKDWAATLVLLACIGAAVRRGIFKPDRYSVPKQYGHDHTAEAVFVLGIISLLMISESLFEASLAAAQAQKGLEAHFGAAGTLPWLLAIALKSVSIPSLQTIHIASFYTHDVTFFFFLCFLPFGKHFHVITSFFNVLFMRVDTGQIKPVEYGVSDEQLDDLESFGVKTVKDFTWKHILDFYSCADCGRCSDQCPANAVGRPLSPRFFTIKGRDHIFEKYPILPKKAGDDSDEETPLVGSIFTEDEIWSCTTCGACERECPLANEYIDKIVDLRRGLVEEGMVPQSLQKPLSALEKRGNPWGKMEKKRADWIKTEGFVEDIQPKVLDKKGTAETLYFVDSITSFDDRMQDIARSTSRILSAMNVDFGILGKAEKDSGNEVRRFGEEMLFCDLKDHNTEAILNTEAKRIVTADPHALNTLKNEYTGLPPVFHISELVAEHIQSGKLSLKETLDKDKVYVYHDPCYLGRHNNLYDAPRDAMDAIAGLNRVEMKKSRDRSFCCGGGGLMLFYEPEEEERMGVLRVQMAKEDGANVIVTACPFCLVNIEDAIKVAGLEGEMEALDFTELIERHL